MLNQTLQFTDQKTVFNFSITGSSPKILIKRAIVIPLMGHEQQIGTELSRLNPMLQVSFYKINGYSMEAPISLNAYLSSYHMQPVLDINRQYPSWDTLNINDFNNFTLCKIEIKHTAQTDIPLNISVLYDSNDLQLAN